MVHILKCTLFGHNSSPNTPKRTFWPFWMSLLKRNSIMIFFLQICILLIFFQLLCIAIIISSQGRIFETDLSIYLSLSCMGRRNTRFVIMKNHVNIRLTSELGKCVHDWFVNEKIQVIEPRILQVFLQYFCVQLRKGYNSLNIFLQLMFSNLFLLFKGVHTYVLICTESIHLSFL